MYLVHFEPVGDEHEHCSGETGESEDGPGLYSSSSPGTATRHKASATPFRARAGWCMAACLVWPRDVSPCHWAWSPSAHLCQISAIVQYSNCSSNTAVDIDRVWCLVKLNMWILISYPILCHSQLDWETTNLKLQKMHLQFTLASHKSEGRMRPVSHRSSPSIKNYLNLISLTLSWEKQKVNSIFGFHLLSFIYWN